MDTMKLINPTSTFLDTPDDAWVIRKDQEITDEFLQKNKELRDSSHKPSGEFHQMASIPTIVVEKWMREGFNIFDKGVTAKEIVERLRREDLEAFLTSNKRI